MTPARKRQNLNEWYGSLIASTKIWPAARSSQLDRVAASVLRAAHVLLQYIYSYCQCTLYLSPDTPTDRQSLKAIVPTDRDGTRGCGCGFGKNPPAGKPAGLGKIRPQVDPRVHFCTRTRTRRVSGGFRVSADLTTAIIRITIQHSNKMKLTINP